jgi:hypothetical protein
MSKPVSRGKPFARPPSATTTWRSARSSMQQVRVDHRREEVVRSADRVDVAGEVQVDLLHRRDLRTAAAGAAAFDPEHGAERGFADTKQRAFTDPSERLDEGDRSRRLAFAGFRRRHRRDRDQLAVGLAAQPVERRQLELRGEAAVLVHLVGCETEARCKLVEGDECSFRRRNAHGTIVRGERASGIRVATVIV